MNRVGVLVSLVFSMAVAFNTMAADLPQLSIGHDGVLHGGNSDFSKTSVDTLTLIGPWGSDAQVNGQFQDPSGNPDWNGWTHRDLTQQTETHWKVSNYAASNLPGGPGNLAAFCGDETYESCDPLDSVGGYGNSWFEQLEFSYVVADAADNCIMQVSGVFNSNTEPGYDFVSFKFLTADAEVIAAEFDGIHQAQVFNYSHAYNPDDYVGSNNDEVRFRIVVTSDGGWSDEDCDYYGNGACQVDDLRVQCSNGDYDGFTDFEDGTWGAWNIFIPRGVGDFADLWVGLEDIDPCQTNYSPQAAFIDDGTKVPGVGPSYCQDWCYGPGGYIVNTTGGADPDGKLNNVIESPVIAWPGDSCIGAELAFDVYRHEDLSAFAPGIFYSWKVRSTADEVNFPIADARWTDRNFVYYGGPDYFRAGNNVSDLLEPGATHVQVQFGCFELWGWWGWDGDNGYPAPYFDNVRLNAFEAYGPGMSTRDIDLAQDNFSASGQDVDLENLASNSVRFDSSQSKTANDEVHNVPGDSITCDVASVRVGGELVSNRLVYTMQRNPVFDSVRDPLWDASGFTDGIRQGTTHTYYYDLPDSGFLFPGDVLHYYFEATDEVGQADPQTSTVPVDITGFGEFNDPMAYDTNFQVRALPSVRSDGSQPSILFWNDFAQGGGEEQWYTSLSTLGQVMGVHYDVYFTHGPTSGAGNGLGGRAVYEQIKGYTDLLYTCGDLGRYTLSNGSTHHDAGHDVQLLTEWFDQGHGRDAFFCGDELVNDLAQFDGVSSDFLTEFMNVQLVAENLRPLIHNQVAPLVLSEAGNSVFYTSESWVAYGGCLGINTFDAVTPGAGAERLACFTNPNGNPDYSYSAATLNLSDNDRIITMPYDFIYIYTDPTNPPGYGVSTRTLILNEILAYFDLPGGIIPPVHSPVVERFFATNYPNPFNPSTEIKFSLPREGHLSLKIYNVRGELVKTLIDETRAAGEGHILWDGTNSQGSEVSSGVYFYEARTGGEVQVSKMALVK